MTTSSDPVRRFTPRPWDTDQIRGAIEIFNAATNRLVTDRFMTAMSWPSFLRYVLVISANLPLSIASLWITSQAMGLAMWLAAPLAACSAMAANFIFSRWAMAPPDAAPAREGTRMVIPSTEIPLGAVAASLGRHVGLYRHRAPHYQTVMLNSLRALWTAHHERIIDIGGGTGVIGQCIDDLLPAGSVVSIDVADRFCKTLAIETGVFDGRTLPYADAAFDAATINNVVHHIPVDGRVPLFREIRRVNRGPLYIKDHLARSALDHLRLGVLDLIGNVPFGGMVRADYLSAADWTALASASGYKIAETVQAEYRSGLFAALFPNRIETAMRWEPA